MFDVMIITGRSEFEWLGRNLCWMNTASNRRLSTGIDHRNGRDTVASLPSIRTVSHYPPHGFQSIQLRHTTHSFQFNSAVIHLQQSN